MKKHKCGVWFGAVFVLSLLFSALNPASILADDTLLSSPDLIIEKITWSPETPLIGNTLTFTVTIKNQGNALAGAFNIAYHIDEMFQTVAPVGPIEPGASAMSTFTWKAVAGSHVIKPFADHNNNIAESNEANNDMPFAFSVLAPDLVIEAITWSPSNPSVGESVNFTATIKNQGNTKAGFFNSDFTIDGSSRGIRTIMPIEPGAATSETYSWVAQEGSHAIAASADILNQVLEGDENNNNKVITYSTLAPDLAIQGVTWTPANFVEGNLVTFSVNVTNQGVGKAEYSHITYYIDSALQATDFINPIDPGEIATSNFSWTATFGFHTLKAVADSEDSILESDETNNEKSVPLPSLAPDLIIQDITCSPAVPLVKQPVSFKVSVKNQGKGIANKSRVYVFIDDLYRLQQDIYEINASETVTVDFAWTARENSHVVKAVADGENYIAETDESNNTKTIQVGFSQPLLSDLIVQDIAWSPQNPTIGDSVTFNVTIKNQGTGEAGTSTLAYYVDNTCLETAYVSQIPSGATATIIFKWTAHGGSHIIKAMADSNAIIKESNETNNERSVTMSVTAPDLAIKGFTFSPVNPSTGAIVTFTVTVENRGNERSGHSYIAYYVDGSFRGNNDLPELPAGASVVKTFTWSYQTGSHSLKVKVDPDNQVSEVNESNNERIATIPAPDLIIDSIIWSPVNPTQNDTVTFTISAKNQSGGRAEPCSIGLDIDGSSLVYEDIQAIEAGDIGTGSFVWEAQAGPHTMKVIVDALNQIFESNENNNEQTFELSIALPVDVNSESSSELQPEEGSQLNTSNETSPEQANMAKFPKKSSTEKDSLLYWWLVIGVVVLAGIIIAVMLKSRQQPR